ncbi:vWA domain-containing protein [Ruminococcus albus]|uniref:von Willebrand factor type A domain-containing protein n=1 Tax=Ruminococcus albus TaxID=1264 RepID=A0A1I1PG96_RUMAL|nr:vWA domain-containing protein [Ruminococcus albus]SFD08817.1 von Willebrand factor type A domain-containing protein [Ruminococcus albus]
MKKMDIRKITAMTAALVMCISMASCGQADTSSAKGGKAAKKSGTTKSVTDAETAAETTTAAAKKAEASEDAGYEGEMADMKMETAADADMAMTTEGMALDAAAKSDDAASPALAGDEDILPGEPDTAVDGKAFVLTAGEWNDNNNWGFFTNLAKNGTINFPVFGFDPTHRIAVTVTKDGEPAREQLVELLDSDGNLIWMAKSDKNGMAYVFYKNGMKPAKVRCGESVQEVTGDSNDGQGDAGTNEVTLEAMDSKKLDDTQVMFILDTTGSMGDEIAYLQMDFASIAEDVDDGHTTFSVNFYRDEGDDYVTKCNRFTNNVKVIQDDLNRESATGGGDFPEAVAEILEETITDNDEWSESANKIAFLIFDAPPHDGKEDKLEAAVQTAAAKGIHLVPVVSSGADRDTELFGRAIAAETNSNYIFLTDDSGVGGSHLEPIIGDYDVELLHDIIVRNITSLRD